MRVKVTARSMAEYVKRVKDLEKRGYGCVYPMKKVYDEGFVSRPLYSDKTEIKRENFEGFKYMTIMEKPDNGG